MHLGKADVTAPFGLWERSKSHGQMQSKYLEDWK